MASKTTIASFARDKLRHTQNEEERGKRRKKVNDIKWRRLGERKERQRDKSGNSRQAASV